MKRLRKEMMFLVLVLISSITWAQNKNISGKVVTQSNEPVVGASVTVKGFNAGTTTNETGEFSLSVPASAKILVISSVGFHSAEVAITGNEVHVILESAAGSNLEEVVVVGYGTQKKTSLTASVASIKGGDMKSQPVGDLTNALGGRASGVIFTQGSGQAGNDASRILIRGIGSNGNSSPLLIVDGVPRNFSQLNPADVESISVLKDAAAVAPYGLGGANGVILVTTKQGKLG
ncbi:MAG: carboxypeptidase-like regulatory domain-containing protein [Chitinophagaceae bacterium]|nr:carboxypeptidase-like regulatory domain-containing protein [Chitinophagaceae bacterium]